MSRICQFESRRSEIVSNLLRLYSDTSDADKVLGSEWYTDARRIVREWSNTYQLSVSTVACVIAAISPQCVWERNLIIADDVLADRVPSVGGIWTNIAKARRIRDDGATNTLDYFPQGPKVASFAANLAGDDDIVTVDSHAMQAALMNPIATTRLSWLPYTIFAECYAHAAKRSQLPPATFQAIIWCYWKRLHPPANKRAMARERKR